MNPFVKRSLMFAGRATGLAAACAWRHRGDLRIVTYHGVCDDPDPVVNHDRMQVAPAVFRSQLAAMARRYRVRPLREIVDAVAEGRRWETRTLAITFDDGYRNNLDEAAPVLREMGLPATFFVTTGFVAGRRCPWWYRLRSAVAQSRAASLDVAALGRPDVGTLSLRDAAARAYAAQVVEAWLVAGPARERERLWPVLLRALRVEEPDDPYPLLDPPSVRQLVNLGFDVESHGDGHLSFRHDDAAACEAGTRGSVERLEAWTGRRPALLAYPYGHAPQDLAAWTPRLRAMGLHGAVTVGRPFNRPETHPFALSRLDVTGGRDAANISLVLAGLWPIGYTA